MSRRDRLTDIEVVVHFETQRFEKNLGAVLVSLKGDREKAVWLPKSAIEVERRPGGKAEITLPESLATEKGLV